jgi:hypothetical protein
MTANGGFTATPFGAAAAGTATQQAPDPQATSPQGNGQDLNPWPLLNVRAHHGLAGEAVAALLPHTESDPVALQLQFMTSFGNAVGHGPHYRIEGDQHFPNIYVILVGDSAKSRKGTSAGRVRSIFRLADADWADHRIMGGMSSGEGIIHTVRDETMAMRKGVLELIDAGIADKRLLLDEREFFQALAVMKREGNVVSRVIRDAWDCLPVLRTLTKQTPSKATGAHISIVGHITAQELQETLDHTSMANGYANRFLFACVRRSKLLPHGGALDGETITELGGKTYAALEQARPIGEVTMTPAAKELWVVIYARLSEGAPGLLGAITQRADAQTIRLALLYALLDGSTQIDLVHLEAAEALWAYCEASARYIFGDLFGERTADAILRALRAAGAAGMTQTDIRDLFQRHAQSSDINRALSLLLANGKVRFTTTPAKRGPWTTKTWFAL